MKNIFTKGFVCSLILVGSFALTQETYAYFTTDQQAVSISEQSAIYTISFRFGSKDDLYMPITAVRDLPNRADEKKLGYEILEESKAATTTGVASGIVLSDAEIVDGMYKIKRGESATFTLVVAYTVDDSDEETDYALRVTELPFYVGDNMTSRSMNPSELQYYISPEAEMNSSK